MLSAPLICAARDQRDRRSAPPGRSACPGRIGRGGRGAPGSTSTGSRSARRPAGDALAEAERRAQDLVGPLVAREHGRQHAAAPRRPRRSSSVSCGISSRERVGDPLEQRVEALLGEHLVEDVGEPPIGLDELGAPYRSGAFRDQPESVESAAQPSARKFVMRGDASDPPTEGKPKVRGRDRGRLHASASDPSEAP